MGPLIGEKEFPRRVPETMFESMKIGARNLAKRRGRTTLTILAIGLGVAILVGVNMGTDTIVSSVQGTLDKNLGGSDIIVNLHQSVEHDEISRIMDNATIDGLVSWVPRVLRYNYYVMPAKLVNETGLQGGWPGYRYMGGNIGGIDASLSRETGFGRVRVRDYMDEYSDKYSGEYTPVEVFLEPVGEIAKPLVVTTGYLKYHGLEGNISAGDTLLVKEKGSGSWNDPTTWGNYTITAVVDDLGEMGSRSLNTYGISFLFVNIDLAWNLVEDWRGLAKPVDFLMVDASDAVPVEDVRDDLEDYLEDNLDTPFSLTTPKKSFVDAIAPAMDIIRAAFSLFAGISLVVCGILIKNLFETAKQTDIREIGILKGIGFSQFFISRIYLTQIFILSTLGIIIGLGIGTGFAYVFVDYLSNTTLAKTFLNISFDVEVSVSISLLTLGIGILGGYTMPLVFGSIPVLQTARTSVVKAIHSRASSTSAGSVKRSIVLNIVVLVVGIALLVVGTFYVSEGTQIVLFGAPSSLESYVAPALMIVFGVVGFLLGMIMIGIFCLPIITRAFTYMFLLPVERSLKKICYRNLMRNKRRTINTFMMMAIGLSLTVAITTITNSIVAGIYPRNKTILGGDVLIGPSGRVSDHYSLPVNRSFLGDLSNLSAIHSASLYRPSIDMYRFYGSSIDGFGNKIDGFGYTVDGPSISPIPFEENEGGAGNAGGVVSPAQIILPNPGEEEKTRKYFNVGIIDGAAYYSIHANGILRLPDTGGRSLQATFQMLDSSLSIILQSSLKEILGKGVGDNVTLEMEGMVIDLEIIGFADVLPGVPWTIGMESVFNLGIIDGWGGDNVQDFCGLISWNTYDVMIDSFYRDTDLLVKNKFWQEGLPYYDETQVGYIGFPINVSLVASLLAPYLSNGTIQAIGYPIMNALPMPLTFWNDRPFEYHQDGNQTSNSTFQPQWNEMESLLYGIDDSPGHEFGGIHILEVDPAVPENMSGSVESILQWSRSQPGIVPCVVNRDYLAKDLEDPAGLFDRFDFDSFYRFHVGDKIRVDLGNGLFQDLTVVATVASHYNYQFDETRVDGTNETRSAPWVFNPKVLNFNSEMANSAEEGDFQDFLETFMIGANTVMVSRTSFEPLLQVMMDQVEQYLDMLPDDLFPNLSIDNITLLSELAKFNNSWDQYADLVQLKVSAGTNITALQADLQALFASIPGTENFTVFNPRKTFFEVTGLDRGFAFLGVDEDQVDVAVEQVKALYASQNITYDEDAVWYYGKETGGWNFYEILEGVMEIITTVFNMILAFSLVISLLGLSISMLMSTHQRRREIGTLRSVGFSRRRILVLVYGENMTLGLLGIIIGLVAGIIAAYTMISQVPFTIALPLVFSPPMETYAWNSIVLFGISLIASIIPATQASRLDVAEVLRSQE